MVGSVKVVLFRSKTLKNGEHPVMLRVTKGKKQSYAGLGFSCADSQWDDKTSRPKKSHPLYGQLLKMCDEKETNARKEMLNAVEETKTFSMEEVLQAGINKPKSEKGVIEFFDETIDRLKQAGRVGYAATFKDTRNHLVSMMGKKEFEFVELGPSFLLKWESAMQGKGLKKTSISLYFRTLRVLVGYARTEGVVKKSYNPFEEFPLTKYRKIETPKKSITQEDVLKIARIELPAMSDRFHAQQFFLFSYYCRGINLVDVANLTTENMHYLESGEVRLRYTRKKTGHYFDIKMLEPAIKIWEFYQGRRPPRNKYVWPILHSQVHVLPQQINWRIERICRQWNQGLRLVAKEAEIGEYLTLYVARHSFAMAMKNSGASTTVISELLGHESEETTRIYLRQFPQQTLDNASQALIIPGTNLRRIEPEEEVTLRQTETLRKSNEVRKAG
ncbi:site-specific integrase [Spirosoma terrae]|uniref:Site-specific integrase n=1 Tax=Spirosoma terrae TaxID=1968276 RepID=A0A6L9L5P8_9BACT|nr:site-specific integrase [Spirosoma terrae]NDU95794.1 site-specific integrase [Spirosoma terrae]